MATASSDTIGIDRMKYYHEVFKEKGFTELKKAITDDISGWKNVDIRIAVAGKTGAGKWSLINALRGLDADSDKAAPVGVNETTKEIDVYEHPRNPKFIFCDLPGVGSVNFPEETYFRTIDFNSFHMFILVIDKRFSDKDAMLANQIASRHKRFFFVRAKIGNDVKNNAKSKKNKKSEEEILETIREDCKKQLLDVARENDIFLVDNHRPEKYDFPLLANKMIDNTDDLIREAIVMSLEPLTQIVLAEKFSYFKKRMWKVSFLAALAPRIGDKDIQVLLEEKANYREVFDLGDNLASSTEEGNIRADLESDEQSKYSDIYHEEFHEIKSCFPFLPLIYNQVKTYKASKIWLDITLQKLYKDAIGRHTSKK